MLIELFDRFELQTNVGNTKVMTLVTSKVHVCITPEIYAINIQGFIQKMSDTDVDLCETSM